MIHIEINSSMPSPEIRSIVFQLPKNCIERKTAVALMSGIGTSKSDRQILLESLMTSGYGRWKKKVVALWVLSYSELTDEERYAANIALVSILEHRPKRYIALWICCMFAFHIFGWTWIGITTLNDSRRNWVRAAAADALSRIGTISCAYALGKAIVSLPTHSAAGEKQVQLSSIRALNRILPQMEDYGYGQMPPGITGSLAKLLVTSKPDVILSVLEMLRMIGEPEAILDVERLRRVEHRKSINVRVPQIEIMAEEALIVLKARQAHQQSYQTLLRHSAAPDAPKDQLLRAASDSNSVRTDLLLRSSSNHNSSSNSNHNQDE